MKVSKLPVLFAAGVTLMGCADATMVGPTAAPATGPRMSAAYDGSVPYYSDSTAVPAPYWLPEVYQVSPIVYWDGAEAVGSSSMHYFGNRAEEKFTLTISGPSSGSREAQGSSNHFWPDFYDHTTPGFRLAASGTCGHLANLASQHTAKSVLFIEVRGFTSSEVTKPGGDSKAQPTCPPPPETSGSGGSSGGSGGSGGSVSPGGVCFYSYDYYIDTGEPIPGSYHIIACTTDGTDGR